MKEPCISRMNCYASANVVGWRHVYRLFVSLLVYTWVCASVRVSQMLSVQNLEKYWTFLQNFDTVTCACFLLYSHCNFVIVHHLYSDNGPVYKIASGG